ncbi:hypothetical protein HFO62_29950 [Rhizobium leguminosarum]|nr:hypothetical protein [Rhizobium leguminosarum]
MQLIKSRDVLRLTGLTADQLREWTVRRGLIRPDFPAQKRGSEAKFSWQTVLLLRLAMVLRAQFHVELQAHRELLAAARELLGGQSFPALWGFTLAVYDFQRCQLVGPRMMVPPDDDAILLRLDRHLDALSRGFDLADPTTQFPLFPVVGLQTRQEEPSRRYSSKGASS